MLKKLLFGISTAAIISQGFLEIAKDEANRVDNFNNTKWSETINILCDQTIEHREFIVDRFQAAGPVGAIEGEVVGLSVGANDGWFEGTSEGKLVG